MLLSGLVLNLALKDKDEFYQVVASHAHDLEVIKPYLDSSFKSGRLWVVKIRENIPVKYKIFLRRLKGGEKNYSFKTRFNKWFDRKNSNNTVSQLRKINQKNIVAGIEQMASFRTRYMGSADNQKALQLLENTLSEMGLQTHQSCFAKGACNLIAEKKGRSNEIIILMAHIDSVGNDFAGADDNATGIAVLMEIARVVSEYRNNKTLRFVITNGEELGLLGATHYARQLERNGELTKISLLINMDMVGYNQNGVIELESDPIHEPLVHWFSELAHKYTSLKPKVNLGAWGSDHVIFLEKGVPSVLTIQDWNTKNPCFHSECDTIDKLNFDYVLEVAKLNLSAIITKDQLRN